MSLTDWLKRLFAPPQRYEYRIVAFRLVPGQEFEHVLETGERETFPTEADATLAMKWAITHLRQSGYTETFAEVRVEGGFAQHDVTRSVGSPPPGTPFDADASVASMRMG